MSISYGPNGKKARGPAECPPFNGPELITPYLPCQIKLVCDIFEL